MGTGRRGADEDLIIGNAYIEVLDAHRKKRRSDGFDDISVQLERMVTQGAVVLGGDFNSRTSANGDTTTNTAGKGFLQFCLNKGLTVVNHLRDIVRGEFSRVQQHNLADGSTRTDRTTIDYVLLPDDQVHRVRSMKIEENTHLSRTTGRWGWMSSGPGPTCCYHLGLNRTIISG